ncbi:hypothetical protein HN51_026252, partial [Arachis hypogaea]
MDRLYNSDIPGWDPISKAGIRVITDIQLALILDSFLTFSTQIITRLNSVTAI